MSNPEDDLINDDEGGVAVAEEVMPFEIEADHPRNSDLLIQCIPGLRLRSRLDGSKSIKDSKSGDDMVPIDQVHHLGAFPKVPGMRLAVNPIRGEYVVMDPLHGDEELCEKIRKHLNRSGPYKSDRKIEGVAPQKGKLDSHSMKSLVRELYHIVNNNQAKLTKGKLPREADIEEMEGDFLLNPGSRVFNTQPRFEKDLTGWISNLAKSGG